MIGDLLDIIWFALYSCCIYIIRSCCIHTALCRGAESMQFSIKKAAHKQRYQSFGLVWLTRHMAITWVSMILVTCLTSLWQSHTESKELSISRQVIRRWWGILPKAGYSWSVTVVVSWDSTELSSHCLPQVPGFGLNQPELFVHTSDAELGYSAHRDGSPSSPIIFRIT